MPQLATGDRAPEFALPDQNGRTVTLDDLRSSTDKGVIVYFYPRANTPGCTTEACDFTEKLDEFSNAKVTVIGISPDPTEKLADFRAKHDLGVELLGDESKETLTAYGAFGEKKMYGKVTQGVIRSTFLVDVDADGVGTIAQCQYNVRASGHVGRILRDWDL